MQSFTENYYLSLKGRQQINYDYNNIFDETKDFIEDDTIDK